MLFRSETSLQTTAELASLIPEGVPLISESGISGPQDIDYLSTVGAHGVLVGEYLMRQANVEDAVNGLLGTLPNGKVRALHG